MCHKIAVNSIFYVAKYGRVDVRILEPYPIKTVTHTKFIFRLVIECYLMTLFTTLILSKPQHNHNSNLGI